MIRYKVKEGCLFKLEGRVYTAGEIVEFDIDDSDANEVDALREYLAPRLRKLEPLEDAPSRPPIGYTTREMEPEAPRQVESDLSSDIELGDFTD